MRKLTLGMAAAACIFAACKAPAGDAGPSAMDKNKQTAMAAEAGFNTHSADAVFKDCAADFADYGNGDGKPMKNIDSMKTGMKSFFTAFPDFKGENLVAYADSNTVVVTGTWSGTFKSDFMKMKATGKTYKAMDADIYAFNKDGKITSHKSIQSDATFFYQLGLPMPPKK
jgi:predicted ester cyclase